MGIKPAERHCPTKYLGIPISSVTNTNTKTVWVATMGAAHQRLVVGALKTSDVEQRCKLASAIIIPKILYVSRHSWPTAAIVGELAKGARNFVRYDAVLRRQDGARY